MTVLLEMKESLRRFYAKNDILLLPLFRFIAAFAVFGTISKNVGYMELVSQTPVTLILSLICSLLSANFMLLIAAAVMLLDFYTLSMEVAVVALLLFLILYFVYFRFSPKDGYSVALTPICFRFGIPYVMPVGVGLLGRFSSVFAVICGIFVYFFVDGIKENTSVLDETIENADKSTSKIVALLNQLISNREMYLFIAVFFAATILVHAIRKLDMEHSWTIAWISGIVFEGIGMIAGYMMLGITTKTAGIIIGLIVSAVIGLVIQFFCFNVDYSRTERLQFEDDDYYYYVKAIPKSMVPVQNKKVKRFSGSDEKDYAGKDDSSDVVDFEEL